MLALVILVWYLSSFGEKKIQSVFINVIVTKFASYERDCHYCMGRYNITLLK